MPAAYIRIRIASVNLKYFITKIKYYLATFYVNVNRIQHILELNLL